MAIRSEFCDHLCDQLAPMGEVKIRAMFGGFGVYCDGVMFGLVADDTFYLKVDDGNRERFEQAGLPPFVYRKKKEGADPVVMSYREAPPDALDDAELLCDWARGALEAAQRAKKAAPRRKRR